MSCVGGMGECLGTTLFRPRTRKGVFGFGLYLAGGNIVGQVLEPQVPMAPEPRASGNLERIPFPAIIQS